MTTRVVNKKRHIPTPDDVYIGRPSKWGNPFRISANRSREQAVAAYFAWIIQQPALMNALPELKGKTLVCWCKPDRCHGDVLVQLISTL